MQNKQDKIDQYINREMTEPDRAAFEKAMEADAALKAEVEEQEMLARGIREKSRQDIRSMVQSVQQDYEAGRLSGNLRVRRLRIGLAIAASIAILVVAGILLFNNPGKTGPEIAQTEEIPPTDEEAAGVARPVNQFKVVWQQKDLQDASPSWVTTGEETDVLVYQHRLSGYLYEFKNNQLSIYTASPDQFDATNLSLHQLRDQNGVTYFLKQANTFFVIKKENQARMPLRPLTDGPLLDQLK